MAKKVSNRPLISIITPLFNGGNFIDQTIKSVQAQDYQNWELVVIDDLSSDNGCEIVRASQEKDERIRLIHNNKNLGPAATRNRGIEAAQGRYIAFLDSDDLWHPDKLGIQLDFMISNSVPFSFTHYQQIDESGSFIRFVDDLPAVVTYQDLLKFNYIGCLTAVYDTDFFGKVYMKDIRNRQDYALWLTLVKISGSAHCIKNNLASYRIRSNSISSNKLKMIKYHWYIYYSIERLGLFKSIYLVLNYIARKVFRR